MGRKIIQFRKRPNAVRVPVGIATFVVLVLVGDVAKSNIPKLGCTVPYAVIDTCIFNEVEILNFRRKYNGN